MSFGDGSEWYLASLARNNGEIANSWRDNAKEWEAYAKKLEAENKRLKCDVIEWQVTAVQAGARGLAREEIIKSITGNDAYTAAGGEPVFRQIVEKMRPIAKQRSGAEHS